MTEYSRDIPLKGLLITHEVVEAFFNISDNDESIKSKTMTISCRNGYKKKIDNLSELTNFDIKNEKIKSIEIQIGNYASETFISINLGKSLDGETCNVTSKSVDQFDKYVQRILKIRKSIKKQFIIFALFDDDYPLTTFIETALVIGFFFVYVLLFSYILFRINPSVLYNPERWHTAFVIIVSLILSFFTMITLKISFPSTEFMIGKKSTSETLRKTLFSLFSMIILPLILSFIFSFLA